MKDKSSDNRPTCKPYNIPMLMNGVVKCTRLNMDRTPLVTADFYRTHTPIPYLGDPECVHKDVRPKVRAEKAERERQEREQARLKQERSQKK